MLKRLVWRIQYVEQIRKLQKRKREMWARHEAFAMFLQEEVLKPMMRRHGNV